MRPQGILIIVLFSSETFGSMLRSNVITGMIVAMAVLHVEKNTDFFIEKENRARQTHLMKLEAIFEDLDCDVDGNVILEDLHTAFEVTHVD